MSIKEQFKSLAGMINYGVSVSSVEEAMQVVMNDRKRNIEETQKCLGIIAEIIRNAQRAPILEGFRNTSSSTGIYYDLLRIHSCMKNQVDPYRTISCESCGRDIPNPRGVSDEWCDNCNYRRNN